MGKWLFAGIGLLLLSGCTPERRVADANASSRETVAQAASPDPVRGAPVDVKTVAEAVDVGDRASQQLLAALPRHPDAMEMRARYEFELGSPEAAARLWKGILEKYPDYTHALAGLGDFEQDRGNLEAAANFYRRAAETAPETPGRQVKLALCLSEMGRLDEARQLLEAVYEDNPQYAEACRELGAVLLQQRKFKRACALFREAVQLDPADPNAHIGLASAAVRIGDRDLAAKHLELHRKCRRRSRMALAEERRTYNDLQAVSTDVAALLTNMAAVYISEDDTATALQLLKQATVLSRTHVGSRRMLADLANQHGDSEQALYWQQQVAELSPRDLQATMQQAMMLGAAGRLNEAEQTVAAFVGRNPRDAAAVMMLAQFYVDVKPNLRKAIELTQRGTELAPNAEDLTFLAALQELSGDQQAAEDTLRKAAELSTSGAEQQQLLTALRQKLRANSKLVP